MLFFIIKTRKGIEMKKILLVSLLTAVFSAPTFAQSEPGYLTSGSGAVVKSGFGLCWNTSSTKVPNAECGDVVENKVEAPKQAAAPVVVREQVAKQTIQQAKIVVNAAVLFKFDSAVISKEGRSLLVEKVVSLKPVAVEVYGHTDQIGSEKYNQVLSEKRAEAVKAFLVSQGLNKDIITTKGYGESQLLCKEAHPSKNGACASKNRRVEIVSSYVKD